MFQRLNSNEIAAVLDAAWDEGQTKKFRGSAPCVVSVHIQRDGDGAIVTVEAEPRGHVDGFSLPISTRAGLVQVAERIEPMIYPPEEAHA